MSKSTNETQGATASNAEAEKILADAKAEAEKIRADAKEKMQAELAEMRAQFEKELSDMREQALAQAKAAPSPAPKAKPPEEMVAVRLFKDNGRYKDDVFVAVNGRRFQIKRGVTVRVPKCVADVLEQSQLQDQATAALIEQKSSEFAEETRARGL